MYDVLIIGAGVCGTGIARELSRYNLKIGLIDKNNDVSNGTTKANSAIVHAGYDAKPGTLMAKYNAEGNQMFDKLRDELSIPFKRIGSFVLAFNTQDVKTIQKLYSRGLRNQIPDMEILDKDQLHHLESKISPNAIGALYAPTAGIVGPWELAIAYAENAIDNGVELFLNNTVTAIEKRNDVFMVTTNKDSYFSRIVINAAGVYSDKINNMVAPSYFKITPRRGEYFVLDKSAGKDVHHVLFPTPTEKGKGILITPTVHGNVLVGPNSVYSDSKDSTATTYSGLDEVRQAAAKTMESISFRDTINTFSGLRAEPDTGDFIIGESPEVKNFINVAGIKSPGLSAAPAIAVEIAEIVKECLGDVEPNETFNPYRKKQVHFAELCAAEQQELIAKNPKYARVICRCENITEAEIIYAIHRNAGGRTIDGIKRRVRPGTGRCQGGFCLPRVMEILARELNTNIEDILKDEQNSFTLTGKTKEQLPHMDQVLYLEQETV